MMATTMEQKTYQRSPTWIVGSALAANEFMLLQRDIASIHFLGNPHSNTCPDFIPPATFIDHPAQSLITLFHGTAITGTPTSITSTPRSILSLVMVPSFDGSRHQCRNFPISAATRRLLLHLGRIRTSLAEIKERICRLPKNGVHRHGYFTHRRVKDPRGRIQWGIDGVTCGRINQRDTNLAKNASSSVRPSLIFEQFANGNLSHKPGSSTARKPIESLSSEWRMPISSPSPLFQQDHLLGCDIGQAFSAPCHLIKDIRWWRSYLRTVRSTSAQVFNITSSTDSVMVLWVMGMGRMIGVLRFVLLRLLLTRDGRLQCKRPDPELHGIVSARTSVLFS